MKLNVPELDLDLEVVSALALGYLSESFDSRFVRLRVPQSVRLSDRCCRHDDR